MAEDRLPAGVAVRGIGLMLLVTAGLALAGPPTMESVVLFNTTCAQCHEMECSRRLSFASSAPVANASGHIQNYAGPLGATKVAELFGLIKYTKTQCDYYAPQVAAPPDGIWSAEALAPLGTPSRTGWFVPLGNLRAGAWTLDLALQSDRTVEIEVVSRSGPVVQGEVAPAEQGAHLTFIVNDAGTPHFLRLRGHAPISFTRAVLDEQRGKGN